MTGQKNYKKTLAACYLGFVTQAISANFTPLLFLTFRDTYGIGLEQIALIPLVFYFAQFLIDLASAKFVDKIGYRVCLVSAQVLSAAGLALMTVLPELFPAPLTGLLTAVVLYAMGSGLIEVLVNPIVEACPFKNKDGVMSLLHSFYCWGAVAVILGSTLFFAVFGVANWKILALLWALVPLYNTLNFITCPIESPAEDGGRMRAGELLRAPVFWLLILLMACAGSSEMSMAQWASAFTESAVGVSKTVGDLAGPCLFAALMGASRVVYGKVSGKLDLTGTMLLSGVLCVLCYLMAALSSSPALGLAGCALCGVAVGILWPGVIRVSSRECPGGGTAMFAFLALGGDFGATVGPAMVGGVSDLTGGGLRTGLLAAAAFPLILVFGLTVLDRRFKRAPKS